MNPKLEQAVAAAQKNGGVLTRERDGFWRGDAKDTMRFATEVVVALVKDKRATFTRFREGTKAGIEVRIDVADIYERYQMS
jgi:hypothetical protein